MQLDALSFVPQSNFRRDVNGLWYTTNIVLELTTYLNLVSCTSGDCNMKICAQSGSVTSLHHEILSSMDTTTHLRKFVTTSQSPCHFILHRIHSIRTSRLTLVRDDSVLRSFPAVVAKRSTTCFFSPSDRGKRHSKFSSLKTQENAGL